MIKQLAALVLGAALALGSTACSADSPAPAARMAPAPAMPPAPAPLPWPPMAPLSPELRAAWLADRDVTTETDPNHCNDPDWWNAQQADDPGDYVAACGEWPYWIPEEGENACGPNLCGDNGEGLPDDEYYEQYPERRPGYMRCGELCGEEPTSGDVQRQHGCEQGYIPPEEC